MRRMKNLVLVGLVAIIGICGSVSSVMAADASIGADVASAYVWRGMTFNDGMVIQPYLDVTAENGFNANVWANYDYDDYDKQLTNKEFSEVDLTLSYGMSLGPVDLTGGYIEYLFPNAGVDDEGKSIQGTGEIFLSAGISPFEGLSIGLDGYYDVDDVRDFYTNLSVGYDLSLPADISLGFSASAGYAGRKYRAEYKPGLYDYNLSVSLGVPVTDAIELSAYVAHTNSFDDKDGLQDIKYGGPMDVNTYGGVGVSYGF